MSLGKVVLPPLLDRRGSVDLGTRTGQIAYPLLALELTGSPAKAGLLAFGRSAPWFVLSLPAGAIIDRIDRRRLMIGCDIASAVAMATLVAALAAGTLTYEQLLLVALLQRIFAVFFKVAEVGAVRHLVEDDDLPTVMTAIITLATVAGPLGLVLAGFLLQHEGLTVTSTIIAAGVTCVCLLYVGLLTRFRRREAGEAAAAAG